MGDVTRVPVLAVCPCGNEWSTRTRANTVTCHECGRRQYLPASVAGGPPPLQPTPCECSRCGHEWHSRAKDNARIRCPACEHGVRVHRTARPEPEMRPEHDPRPAASGPLSRPRKRPASRPARTAPSEPRRPAPADTPRPERPAASGPRRPRTRAAPAPAPRPAPAPAPRPAPAPAPRPAASPRKPRKRAAAPAVRPAYRLPAGTPDALSQSWQRAGQFPDGTVLYIGDDTVSADAITELRYSVGGTRSVCADCGKRKRRAACYVAIGGRDMSPLCADHARGAVLSGVTVRPLNYVR